MSSATQRFYAQIKDAGLSQRELVDFFVYHLTAHDGEASVTGKEVANCYVQCDLQEPARLASYLSEGLRKPARYVRKNGGYRLEVKRREVVETLLGHDQTAVQTSSALNALEKKIVSDEERSFFKETLDCFHVGANRAALIMCWNLALYRLREYVLQNELDPFNEALSKNKDGRVKIAVVKKHDDFTEMPESKFLLFCREAKIITSSLFNKLELRLDERNAAAHPSGIKTTQKMIEGYIEDLVENVLVKYR